MTGDIGGPPSRAPGCVRRREQVRAFDEEQLGVGEGRGGGGGQGWVVGAGGGGGVMICHVLV